ncbi:MAG: A/G-specific adenine glycosylase [Acidimicrobiia bacterium]|nr:A/G-specific adenine glycosylase [Acidimicrobiia bacterium]
MLAVADVLSSGEARLRDLPWRASRDPWKILIAEVMLQQTQAMRVIRRWHDWCRWYPTPADLSGVPLGDALRRWQGLGYPRRARDLHGAAATMVQRHDGQVPDSVEQLQALPGIGPYTARAVMAFAFERDVGVVDTNIARILARTAGTKLTRSTVQSLADALVPDGQGWLWNQTLMDLGATVCRPKPSCEACPTAATCRWHQAGNPMPDPAAGSAGVSTPQAPYEGSDRQARGRTLAELGRGANATARFDRRIVEGLILDGLVVERDGELHLP